MYDNESDGITGARSHDDEREKEKTKTKRHQVLRWTQRKTNASNKCVIEIKMWFLLWRHESFQSKLALIPFCFLLYASGERNHTRSVRVCVCVCTCIWASLVSIVSFGDTAVVVQGKSIARLSMRYSSSAHFPCLISDVASVPAAVSTNSAKAKCACFCHGRWPGWALPTSDVRIVYSLSTTEIMPSIDYYLFHFRCVFTSVCALHLWWIPLVCVRPESRLLCANFSLSLSKSFFVVRMTSLEIQFRVVDFAAILHYALDLQ